MINQPITTLISNYNSIYDPRWFTNSGATHQITLDPLNLAIIIEFTRNEQEQVRNGVGL